MYWPYQQHHTAGPPPSPEGRAVCTGPRSLFGRSGSPDLKNLRDPPAQEASLMTSFRSVLQPITQRIFRNPVTAAVTPIFNQSALTSAICRAATRMGLDREHEQPACSR